MRPIILIIILMLDGCQGSGRPTDDVCIGICQYTQIEVVAPPPKKERKR